jgi:hypothetical protein
MKKSTVLIMAILTAVVILLILALPKQTNAAYSSAQKPYSFATLRAVSATDDTGPAATGAKWSSMGSSSVTVGGETDGGGIMIIRMLGDGTAGQTMLWALYGAAEPCEPFVCAAYGTAALGITTTGNAAASGQYYTQTITVTATNWPGAITATTGVQYNMGTGVVATAGIGQLSVDTLKWKHWIIKMAKTTTTTSGAEFMNVTVP